MVLLGCGADAPSLPADAGLWERDVLAYPADGDCVLRADGSVFPLIVCDKGPAAIGRWTTVEHCLRVVSCDAGVPWSLECRHPYAAQIRAACPALAGFAQVCTTADLRAICESCLARERAGAVCFRR